MERKVYHGTGGDMTIAGRLTWVTENCAATLPFNHPVFYFAEPAHPLASG